MQTASFFWELSTPFIFKNAFHLLNDSLLPHLTSPPGGKQEPGCYLPWYPSTSLPTAENTDCSCNQGAFSHQKQKARQDKKPEIQACILISSSVSWSYNEDAESRVTDISDNLSIHPTHLTQMLKASWSPAMKFEAGYVCKRIPQAVTRYLCSMINQGYKSQLHSLIS